MTVETILLRAVDQPTYKALRTLSLGKGSRMRECLDEAFVTKRGGNRAYLIRNESGKVVAWSLVVTEDDIPEVHFFTSPKSRGQGHAMILAKTVVNKYGRDCYHVRDCAPKFYKAAGFNKEYAL